MFIKSCWLCIPAPSRLADVLLSQSLLVGLSSITIFKKHMSDFYEIKHSYSELQKSAKNNFWGVKVKVQGQSRNEVNFPESVNGTAEEVLFQFPEKLCTNIHATPWAQGLQVGNILKVKVKCQGGGWPPFWKFTNHNIVAAGWDVFTKLAFGQMLATGNTLGWNLTSVKFKMAASRQF